MKLLWLCNRAPSLVVGGSGGVWMDSVLNGLRKKENICIHILFPDGDLSRGEVDSQCSYASFAHKLPYVYLPEQELFFKTELETFQPDVIHIWGTEYAHTLAMVNAAEALGLADRITIHIQGLCSVYSGHYAEGVPYAVQQGYTFRDLIRQDNIALQQKKFALRGDLEVQALKKVHHVMGRTCWDEACTSRLNPQAKYHYCNETLRQPFYEGQWQYENCQKHRIFASSCVYPVKGFHYLLEAFAEVVKVYPDATLAVPGNSCFTNTVKDRIRQSSYQKHLAKLIRQYGLEDKVEFLGGLSAEQMKENYLKANVFVLPSTIENSPNSLGEAMILGVPCVTSHVGGVTTMLEHETEGYVYQPSASYMLAYYIKRVFSMGKSAEILGAAASAHAQITHNSETNLETLLKIYEEIKER